MTMPDPSPRWTPETEGRALAALWKFGHLGQPLGDDDEPAAVAWTRTAGRSVLTALADAGLLLPPGGETREDKGWADPDAENGVRRHWSYFDHGPYGPPNRRRSVTSWPDGSVYQGPWEGTDGE